MRERIYRIIEVGEDDDKLSRAYDFFMMAAIIISIIPLWSHRVTLCFIIIDRVTVAIFIADYILRLITALVIFNAELRTFPAMFDAIYWAIISLTTVGYGDIYATSAIGRLITMISSVLGIAIVAMPAGIIIAGFQNELEQSKKDNKKE